MAISDSTQDSADLPSKKPKARKSELSAPSNTQPEPKRLKSKKTPKESKSSGDEGNPVRTRAKKEKKMKKRKREADEQSDDDHGGTDVEKKAKKRPKRDKKTEPDVATTMGVASKKRKNKTGFPDPMEDNTLSDQAQKCLAYAFLQIHRPSKWKFNKARQNWLIRNIWSKEMIPELHLPLALAYLGKVQGGVRENLLQSCRATMEPPETEKLPESAEAAPVPAPAQPALPSELEDAKKLRARALIDLLGSPESDPQNTKPS
ncbi:putative uncharacterised conserved protein (DUF2373) [Lyophyllum shimeji]|uniref:Uncharacterized conserved protein (DUF2373) n=1 Tax=Lyophyllum shimeji TaxID=47721 RepID=A0A9P3UHA7_LYOSH|nr:putative uncharacterised conserved protein (DUF2373) [Lyophyllum shimeji]